jgi:hypothetical protein
LLLSIYPLVTPRVFRDLAVGAVKTANQEGSRQVNCRLRNAQSRL